MKRRFQFNTFIQAITQVFFLLFFIEAVVTNGLDGDGSNVSNKNENLPVFISATENQYDPFLNIDNKNKQSSLDENKLNSNEKQDYDEEHIDKMNSHEQSTSDKSKPIVVHNQYPYLGGMEQMRPSYTTPYDYNPYTPSPSNSFQLVGSEKTMEQFLDRLLHESVYDRRIRPFYTDSKNSKPVTIEMNMQINTISGISEVNMEYIVDIFFRQEWNDPRLMYSNSSWKHVEDITLHYDLINKVWTPDAFFRNAKDAKSHMITVPNRLIRIFPQGKVLYSQRLTLRLECPMKLQKFPLDNQTCIINLGSYGYAMKDIKFVWKSDRPVTISPSLEMPDFILTAFNSSVCQRKTATGAYACLEVHFYLKRQFVYYLIQIYIPSTLTCIISFVSFWIDHKAVPARISVGLLTVLTITTQSSGIRSQLPKVSYIKAIDVWMSTCLVFVFAALLEYAVVNVIARRSDVKKQIKNSQNKQATAALQNKSQANSKLSSPNSNEKVLVIGNRLANTISYKKGENVDHLNQSHENLEKLIQPHLNHSNSFKKHPYSNHSLHVDSAVSISGVSMQSTPVVVTTSQLPASPPAVSALQKDDAQMVDFVSSFAFPIMFIIFNIIYWMVYLNMHVPSNS